MIRTLVLLTVCLSLSGCGLLFQMSFMHAWACQAPEKEERCR